MCVGGAINSALQNNDLELSNVYFVNNTAGLYGGSIFLGESHSSILFSNVTVRESSAKSLGGGLFFDRLSTEVWMISCDIVQNSADSGGGVVSFVEGLTVRASRIHDNVAVTAYGGMFVQDAVDFLVLQESSFRRNIAGSSSGGLMTYRSDNVTLDSCEFVENAALTETGGALSFSQSQAILVRNTSFVQNTAALVGGAVHVDAFSSHISFLDSGWLENRAGAAGGGALYVSDSSPVEVNGSKFIANVAQAGSGSAIYVRASNLSMSSNVLSGNRAFGGGTVFWEHASGMGEPAGLQADGNVFDGTNVAGYGPEWATEAHHTRLLDDTEVYSVVDYFVFAPEVGVTLKDIYDQTVSTDSTTFATVGIASSQSASCDDDVGFLSGSTTVSFVNGTASFSSLEPLCAPNHSLGLAVTAVSDTVSDDTAFTYGFRACIRGEYYQERICNPCEEGTYSFTDPGGLALSEITKTLVCQPCPPEALSCYQDTMTLKPGYWRSDNDSTNILECPWDAESCLGGQSSGDASCGSGYHGPLCAVCEDEHHFVASSQTCEQCRDTSSFFDPFTITLIVLMFLCVLVVVYIIKKILRGEKVRSVDDFIALCLLRVKIYQEDMYAREKETLFQHTYMMRVRAYKSCVVYFTFYQIVSTLPFILADVDFPDVYDRLMSAVSVVNLAINQESIASCSSGAEYDYVTKLVVGTTYPMVIVLLLWLCCQIHVWYTFGVSSGMLSVQQMNDRRAVTLRYKKAVLVLTFLILPSGMYVSCQHKSQSLCYLHQPCI